MSGYYKIIVSYCESNGIKMPKEFHDTDPHKFALIDMTIEQRPLLVSETFNYEKQIIDHLKYKNIFPDNYRVLNFKNMREYIFHVDIGLKKENEF